MITFVEVLDAGVVEWVGNNFLQTVFAASTAGIHFHVAEAQLLQVVTQIQWRRWLNVPVKASVQPSLESVGRNANCVECKNTENLKTSLHTSQTREAVVVFPTPGGPDSRAALYPDPSSFNPPNLPNFATTKWKRKQKMRSRKLFLYFLYVLPIQNCTFWYLVAWKHLHCGVCASSATNVEAY